MTINSTWEEAYNALQTQDYKEVLDTEFESGRYYELDWMIKYFQEKGESEKVLFLENLEAKIDAEEGRKLFIGEKVMSMEGVQLEIADFEENGNVIVTLPDGRDSELSREWVNTMKRVR